METLNDKNLDKAKNPDREGVNINKMLHMFSSVFGKKIKDVVAYIDKFDDLDIERLNALTGKKIKNILLDIDGCIAPPYGEILPENVSHIDRLLKKGVRFGVLSNSKTTERLNTLKNMNVPVYEEVIPKPSHDAFLSACKKFNFKAENTIMVGDNPNTDGGAVDLLGGVVIVKPILDDIKKYALPKMISMAVQNVLRDLAIKNMLYKNRKILTSDYFDKK